MSNFAAMSCRGWLEQVQKERGAGGLQVYAAALRCVPYVIPSHWAESPTALADELCISTIHADPVIRQARQDFFGVRGLRRSGSVGVPF